jgi:hypothetical protein
VLHLWGRRKYGHILDEEPFAKGACGSVVGWGTMLQAGRSRDPVPMRWICFNLPNPSSRTMALGSTQPLTEMNEYEESSWGVKGGRRVRLTSLPLRADFLDKMWEPRRLTTLWAFTACYRDSFTILPLAKRGEGGLLKTRSSGNNWKPTFLWYDIDRIENDAYNNSSLPRGRVYQAVAYQRQGDTQTDPQTFLWYDMDRTENEASNYSSVVACIRCGVNVFTEPLPSNDRRDTHTDTGRWEGFMKHAVEMDPSAKINISHFIKTGSGTEKLTGRNTQRARWSHKPAFFFFFYKIRKIG